MNELKRIEKLYLNGKLFEDSDEKGSEGYWDLAGDLTCQLVDDIKGKVAGYTNEQLHDQLQTGFYQVFQKVLVRGEQYD